MRLKPNDLPEMELGERRNVTFKLAGAVGLNSISTFTITSPDLTFGTPIVNGTDVEVLVTAAKTGTHAIIAQAELSSQETVKGFLRAKVVDSTYCSSTRRDYD